jgi:Mg-chelatase subunit ChlI
LLKFSSILSVSIWGRRGQGKSTAAISRRSN